MTEVSGDDWPRKTQDFNSVSLRHLDVRESALQNCRTEFFLAASQRSPFPPVAVFTQEISSISQIER